MTHAEASRQIAELLAATEALRAGQPFTAIPASTTLSAVVRIVTTYLTNPTAITGGDETELEDG